MITSDVPSLTIRTPFCFCVFITSSSDWGDKLSPIGRHYGAKIYRLVDLLDSTASDSTKTCKLTPGKRSEHESPNTLVFSFESYTEFF